MGHRRRPALAVGCLALVIACVAVFVSVYLKAGNQVSVLAVEKAVPQGQVLTVNDLTVVRISMTAGIASVPAAEASAVVGRRAAERLEPNSLLTASELVTNYSPPAGDSIVGVATKEGQIPASGVAPGETVDVVFTGPPGEQDSTVGSAGEQQGATGVTVTSGGVPSSAGTVLVPDATVLEVAPSPASSGSDAVDVSLL
ncbi:MAG TPA: SAF domain-containing protein, partial [Acidimicrobiales bacterium]|nr:SAF domain-containing protein [Acidimicrobiales bacterium]